MAEILVTGATGTVGAEVARRLRAAGADVRAASRGGTGPGAVRFDFTDPGTWDAAFAGVTTAFVMRPPQLGNVRRDMIPALERARAHGLRHAVLLSVQGAESLPVPHATAEAWLRSSGMGWTFLRPAYFDQNLSEVFGSDIRDRHRLLVPCGGARMAFIDALDVAEVAALALLDPAAAAGQAWTLTSDEAPTWAEVAAVLSDELCRQIVYGDPSVPAFWRHGRRELGMGRAQALATTAIHASARLGRSAGLTDDVRRLTGHAPRTLADFAHRERQAWLG